VSLLEALPTIALAATGVGLIGGFFAAVTAIQLPEFFGRRPRYSRVAPRRWAVA
jgi:hypothetical protein